MYLLGESSSADKVPVNAFVVPNLVYVECNVRSAGRALTSVSIPDSMSKLFIFITIHYISLHSSVTKSLNLAKIRGSGKREAADAGNLGKNMRKSGQNIGDFDQNSRSRAWPS